MNTSSSSSVSSVRKSVMNLAWSFVKKNGFTLSEALKVAWANIKLRALLTKRIVRFYFTKVDGSIREAFGTLNESAVPATKGERKTSDSVQTYFDTEKQQWRCFKKCNLIKVAQ